MCMDNDLNTIFQAALSAVDPYEAVKSTITLDKNILRIKTGNTILRYDLSSIDRIVVTGFGKASAPMAKALEDTLGDRLERGIVIVKYGHTVPLTRTELIEAGHPVPDQAGLTAARKLHELCASLTQNDLCLCCISGGGSALLTMPYEQTGGPVILLDEIRKTTGLLLSCGAAIHEINAVRKHLDSIKGGRLAEVLYPAATVQFVLSDVTGDDPSVIASGPLYPDSSTYAYALSVLAKYEITAKIPQTVLSFLEDAKAGRINETPKPGSRVFEAIQMVFAGSNLLALKAAQQKAVERGFNTIVVSGELTGEARQAAGFIYGCSRTVQKHGTPVKRPACLLFGGETTVTLRGSGKGGRNQELALSMLNLFDTYGGTGLRFLSGATDGNDGPTNAAGAFAFDSLLEITATKKLSISDFLANNDSYHFFQQTGGLLLTGPTNTNVCDIQVMLID